MKKRVMIRGLIIISHISHFFQPQAYTHTFEKCIVLFFFLFHWFYFTFSLLSGVIVLACSNSIKVETHYACIHRLYCLIFLLYTWQNYTFLPSYTPSNGTLTVCLHREKETTKILINFFFFILPCRTKFPFFSTSIMSINNMLCVGEIFMQYLCTYTKSFYLKMKSIIKTVVFLNQRYFF